MEYFICTEVKMKCPACDMGYSFKVKDKVKIDMIDVTCKCGAKCKECDMYGHIKP